MNFITIGKCDKCQVNVWPIPDFCANCLGEITKIHTRKATLLEHSKINDMVFCRVEFEDSVRMMGQLLDPPSVINSGQQVFVVYCSNNPPRLFLSAL